MIGRGQDWTDIELGGGKGYKDFVFEFIYALFGQLPGYQDKMDVFVVDRQNSKAFYVEVHIYFS